MRVLFSSTALWGHIDPMLPLARALVALGDELVWAAPAPACGRLEREGFTPRPAGIAPDESLMSTVPRRFPRIAALAPRERPDHLFGKVFGWERAQPMLDDLLVVMDRWRPDFLVRDAAEFASPIAAAVHDVPCVTHALGALLPATRVASAAEDVAPLWVEKCLEPRPYGGSYDHLYLDIYPPSLQPQARPHVPATEWLRTTPARHPPAGARPDALARAGRRPVVYVTLGTVFNDVNVLRRLVDGARELDVFVVVTTGPGTDPLALGPRLDNVAVFDFLPQRELLPHCAAVVSHAGSGTFLGALAEGVPQVCVPLGADQFLNADACVRAGVGLAVEPCAGKVSVGKVSVGLERVLGDGTFAAAAARVRDEIAAMPSSMDAAERLHQRYG